MLFLAFWRKYLQLSKHNQHHQHCTLKDREASSVYSLKCAKNLNEVLSKNMGGRSLLEKYFNAKNEQIQFNNYMDKLHLEFLNNVLNTSFENISLVKKHINEDALNKGLNKPRFNDQFYENANELRTFFLRKLRIELIRVLQNLEFTQKANAVNLILDAGKNQLHADYKHNNEKVNFLFIPIKKETDIKGVSESGNDSVIIESSDYIIKFRYKFESGITSSIKLVGSFSKSPNS